MSQRAGYLSAQRLFCSRSSLFFAAVALPTCTAPKTRSKWRRIRIARALHSTVVHGLHVCTPRKKGSEIGRIPFVNHVIRELLPEIVSVSGLRRPFDLGLAGMCEPRIWFRFSNECGRRPTEAGCTLSGRAPT